LTPASIGLFQFMTLIGRKLEESEKHKKRVFSNNGQTNIWDLPQLIFSLVKFLRAEPLAEMACGVDLGTSVLEEREGSNALANWAMDIGGAVGGGSGYEAVEAEDFLGTIGTGGGGSGTVARALGGQRWQSPEPLPPPPHLPVLQALPARDAMARLLSSLSPSLFFRGVETNIN
jgi:hypothetical protein